MGGGGKMGKCYHGNHKLYADYSVKTWSIVLFPDSPHQGEEEPGNEVKSLAGRAWLLCMDSQHECTSALR